MLRIQAKICFNVFFSNLVRDTTDIVISVQLYYGTVPAISLPELSVHIRNPIEFGQTELSVNGWIFAGTFRIYTEVFGSDLSVH